MKIFQKFFNYRVADMLMHQTCTPIAISWAKLLLENKAAFFVYLNTMH